MIQPSLHLHYETSSLLRVGPLEVLICLPYLNLLEGVAWQDIHSFSLPPRQSYRFLSPVEFIPGERGKKLQNTVLFFGKYHVHPIYFVIIISDSEG